MFNMHYAFLQSLRCWESPLVQQVNTIDDTQKFKRHEAINKFPRSITTFPSRGFKTKITTVGCRAAAMDLFIFFLAGGLKRINFSPCLRMPLQVTFKRGSQNNHLGPPHLTFVSRPLCPCLFTQTYLFDLLSEWPRGFSISIEVKEHDTASELSFSWPQSDS